MANMALPANLRSLPNHAILPQRRRRVSVELRASVIELAADGPLYQAVVSDATGAILWRSVPLPSYGAAEFLGWRHMALLAVSIQDGDL